MKIPHEALVHYLGEDYGKMKAPDFVKALKEKGLKVDGSMTFNEVLTIVEKEYAKR